MGQLGRRVGGEELPELGCARLGVPLHHEQVRAVLEERSVVVRIGGERLAEQLHPAGGHLLVPTLRTRLEEEARLAGQRAGIVGAGREDLVVQLESAHGVALGGQLIGLQQLVAGAEPHVTGRRIAGAPAAGRPRDQETGEDGHHRDRRDGDSHTPPRGRLGGRLELLARPASIARRTEAARRCNRP